jgi:hypothetical protein
MITVHTPRCPAVDRIESAKTSQVELPRRLTFASLRMAALLFLALWMCLDLGGCQVRFVSQYDPQTDAAATELQQRIEGFLIDMEIASQSDLPEDVSRRSYAVNRAFYRDVQVALSSMRLRAEAIPQNELTIQQIAGLEGSIESLRQLHIEGGERGLRPAVIGPARIGLNTHLGAIIRLELAKRRDE